MMSVVSGHDEILIIYFHCVSKTVFFMANSNQTINRNNPNKIIFKFYETVGYLNHIMKSILFHVDLSNIVITDTLS